MKLRFLVFSLLAVLSVPVAYGQEAAPNPDKIKFAVNASLDAYYTYNFTNYAHGAQGSGSNGYFNSYDDALAVGLAEVGFSAKQGEGGAHISLIYGQAPNLVVFPANNLWEGYVYYRPRDWELRVGLVASPFGFERLESDEDWNETKSMVFRYLHPRNNFGFSAEFIPVEKFSVMGYVYSSLFDFVTPREGKIYGLRFHGKPQDALELTLNAQTSPVYLGGGLGLNKDPFASYLLNGIVHWKATDKISVVLEADYGSADLNGTGTRLGYWAAALYGRYQLEKDWAVCLRLEELNDDRNLFGFYNNGLGAVKVEAREATLTVEHKFTANVTARLEGRFDYDLANGVDLAPGAGSFTGGDPYQITSTAAMLFGF